MPRLGDPVPYHQTLRYPVFLVEAAAGEYTLYDVAERQSDFVTFGRVPVAGKYGEGWLFDSSGMVFDYSGSAGWPRFGRTAKTVLESLVLPGILFKPIAMLRYFGPKIAGGRKEEADAFRDLIFDRIRRHLKPKDRRELRGLLDKAATPEGMIRAIDWWRYNGGRRDADGHPLDEGEEP